MYHSHTHAHISICSCQALPPPTLRYVTAHPHPPTYLLTQVGPYLTKYNITTCILHTACCMLQSRKRRDTAFNGLMDACALRMCGCGRGRKGEQGGKRRIRGENTYGNHTDWIGGWASSALYSYRKAECLLSNPTSSVLLHGVTYLICLVCKYEPII